jgi:hypothetical protein
MSIKARNQKVFGSLAEQPNSICLIAIVQWLAWDGCKEKGFQERREEEIR